MLKYTLDLLAVVQFSLKVSKILRLSLYVKVKPKYLQIKSFSLPEEVNCLLPQS